MNKPTGKLLFAYNTITELNSRIDELENALENLIIAALKCDSWEVFPDDYLDEARKALEED